LFAGVRFSSVFRCANAYEHRRTSAESAPLGEHLGEHAFCALLCFHGVSIDVEMKEHVVACSCESKSFPFSHFVANLDQGSLFIKHGVVCLLGIKERPSSLRISPHCPHGCCCNQAKYGRSYPCNQIGALHVPNDSSKNRRNSGTDHV
jgi:hypothetical protein